MYLHIPETLRSINLGEERFFSFQLWEQYKMGHNLFTLSSHANNKKNFIICSGEKHWFLFDGFNSKNNGIIVQTNGYDESKIFYFTYDEKNAYFSFPIVNAGIRSCMLCPEENTIVYAGTLPHNEKTPNYLRIVNIHDDNITFYVAWINFNIHIKKTLSLGKKTYLGLTDGGKLIVFWQEKDDTIKYAKQKHHKLRFCDIAIDNSVITKSGLKPHIALLGCPSTTNGKKEYELFACDLLSFKTITPFLIKKIVMENSIVNKINYLPKLFYDKKQCGILWYEYFSEKYTHVVAYPDNLGALYFAKIIGLKNEYLI